MTDKYTFNFFDFLLMALKYKTRFISLFFITLISSYLFILFTMKPQYDSSATVIPSKQESMAGIFSLVNNFKSALPGGLSSLSIESDMNLFNTIIHSRTSLDTIIEKFELKKIYKFDRRSEMIKGLREMISVNTTLDNSYVISVRTVSRKLSLDICNHILKYLNNKIIELNVSKSKENRVFLETRYKDVKEKLTVLEDSLKSFQVETGIIEAESQAKAALELYAKLESQLAIKQVEKDILRREYGNNSLQVKNAKIAISEYSKKLKKMHKNSNNPSSTYIGISAIPEKMLSYYRLYREVKIQNEIMNFIVPLLEQARFEEQKTLPILQVIDYPIEAERKCYPPRTLFAGISALSITLLVMVFMFLFNLFINSEDNKLIEIRKHLNIKK